MTSFPSVAGNGYLSVLDLLGDGSDIVMEMVFRPTRSSGILLYNSRGTHFLGEARGCHQTVVFHLSTQDFAVSLNCERSSKMQGRARRVHCSMCAVFSVAIPHSHVVFPSKYFHLFRCILLHCNAYVVC